MGDRESDGRRDEPGEELPGRGAEQEIEPTGEVPLDPDRPLEPGRGGGARPEEEPPETVEAEFVPYPPSAVAPHVPPREPPAAEAGSAEPMPDEAAPVDQEQGEERAPESAAVPPPAAPPPAATAPPPASPVEPRDEPKEEDDHDRPRRTVGIILIVLGAWFFLQQFFDFWNWGELWPILLILLGLLLLFRR